MKVRQVLSMLLAVFMLFSLLPVNVLTAVAAEIEEIKAFSTIGSEPVGATNDLLVNTCSDGSGFNGYNSYNSKISTSGQCGEKATWSFNLNDKTLYIKGSGPMWDIPTYKLKVEKGQIIYDFTKGYSKYDIKRYKLFKVTASEDGYYVGNFPEWTMFCNVIEHVKIEEGITRIGDYSFYYLFNVIDIQVPTTVRSVGDCSFFQTAKLETINLSGCTEIEEKAFYVSGIKSVELFDSIKFIGAYAFGRCINLTELSLPQIDTVSYIWLEGTPLKNVTFKDSAKKIPDRMFAECTTLESVNLNKIEEIGTYAFRTTKISSLKLPDTLKKLGVGAFYGCKDLSGTITIPSGVTNIPAQLFSQCSGIKGIIISNDVAEIGRGAFSGCTSLESINAEKGQTGVYWPEKVTVMNSSVFDNCTSIKEIYLPTTLEKISKDAIVGCTALTKIVLPSKSITTIEDSIKNSPNLVHIEITDNPTKELTLSNQAFPNAHICYTLKFNVSNTSTIDYEDKEYEYTHRLYNKPYNETGMPLPTKVNAESGYDFVNWIDGKGNKVNDTTNPGPFVGSHNLYEFCLQSYYQVKFDTETNGGVGGLNVPLQIKRGLTVQLNEQQASRPGWEFVGWNTDKNAKEGLKSVTIVDQDIVLYAIFKKDVTLKFHMFDGGKVSEITKTITYYNLEENTLIDQPTSKNYNEWQFVGWTTSTKNDADPLFNLDEKLSANLNSTDYYALFRRDYTLTYGDCENILQDLENTVVTAKLNIYDTKNQWAPTVTLPEKLYRPGFELIGWRDETDQKKYPVGSEIVVSCDKTVTALWDQYVYIITFNSRGGESVDNIEVEFNKAYGTLPTTTLEGYTFGGWFDDLSFTNEVKADSIFTAKKNQILYAKWIPNQYEVSFFTYEGGQSPEAITVTYDSPYGVLPIVTRDYYVFDGWYTSPGEDGELILGESVASISSNHILYAHWIRVEAQVIFNTVYPNGKVETDETKVRFYEYIDLSLYNREYKNEVFIGWFTDPECTNLADIDYFVDDDLEVINFYSGWLNIYEYIDKDEDDSTTAFIGKFNKVKSFDMFGVQLKDKDDHSLRFMTRLSEKIISDLERISDDEEVDYGYLVIKKDNLQLAEGEELTVSTDGVQLFYSTPSYFENDYLNFDDYRIYTMAIENIPESDFKTEYVVRGFVKFKDLNGDVKYIYTTDTGSNSIGGAYYTSYKKVVDYVEMITK